MDINQVVETYKEQLKNIAPCKDATKIEHVRWMLDQIPLFLEQGKIDKANRWIGFIQGFFWTAGRYTIEEMKDHNR